MVYSCMYLCTANRPGRYRFCILGHALDVATRRANSGEMADDMLVDPDDMLGITHSTSKYACIKFAEYNLQIICTIAFYNNLFFVSASVSRRKRAHRAASHTGIPSRCNWTALAAAR